MDSGGCLGFRAGAPAFAAVLARHRGVLDQWIGASGDRGQQTESLEALLQVLVRWGHERCLNPEYDLVRAKYKDIIPELLEQRARWKKKRAAKKSADTAKERRNMRQDGHGGNGLGW